MMSEFIIVCKGLAFFVFNSLNLIRVVAVDCQRTFFEDKYRELVQVQTGQGRHQLHNAFFQ